MCAEFMQRKIEFKRTIILYYSFVSRRKSAAVCFLRQTFMLCFGKTTRLHKQVIRQIIMKKMNNRSRPGTQDLKFELQQHEIHEL